MFLFPPVLFGEPRLVVYEEMHGAHWNMVLVYVSLLLLRPPVSRALGMDLPLDGFGPFLELPGDAPR